MPSPVVRIRQSTAIDPRLLPAVNRLLIAGMKLGPAGKHDTINKLLQLMPGLRRGDCWQRMRQLRKALEVTKRWDRPSCCSLNGAAKTEPTRSSARRWTAEDDDKLLNWAGYEPVDKIAHRLSRSVRAVRFRLCALGISARVTDGWSLRALRKLLRVSPARLKRFIGTGMLRVRDPRITSSSLVQFCHRNRTSFDPSVVERIAVAVAKKREAYPWERAADLLGVAVAQVQSWISAGQLKVLDTFVTDRSFERFCKRHGSEINITLIDPATSKWLIGEYGVRAPATNAQIITRAQKHALKVRTCNCGRKIAGNVYFRHAKACKVAADQAMRQSAYESSAGKALSGSI